MEASRLLKHNRIRARRVLTDIHNSKNFTFFSDEPKRYANSDPVFLELLCVRGSTTKTVNKRISSCSIAEEQVRRVDKLNAKCIRETQKEGSRERGNREREQRSFFYQLGRILDFPAFLLLTQRNSSQLFLPPRADCVSYRSLCFPKKKIG